MESIFGNISTFTGPPGADYTINDDEALYDTIPAGQTKSCSQSGDCYSVTVSVPDFGRPPHWDALLQESFSLSQGHTWVIHLGESFPDVPTGHQFYPFIETLFHNGVTTGCAAGGYCPGDPVTRAQMAVFLLKSKFGSAHIPPPCTGTVYTDVPCTGGGFDPWIEELAALQITGGCGGTNYCPGNTVTRQQMAVFLLKAFEGSTHLPPDCTGIFDDVTCTPGTGFSDWIEELYNRGITGGCSVTPLSTARPTRTTAARWRCSSSRRSVSCSTEDEGGNREDPFRLGILASLAIAGTACQLPPFLPEFQVNTSDTDENYANDVAMSEHGDFIVTWSESTPDLEVFGRRFNADTTPSAAPFPVNANTALDRESSSIARDASADSSSSSPKTRTRSGASAGTPTARLSETTSRSIR